MITIDAFDILCAQLTHDPFATVQFLSHIHVVNFSVMPGDRIRQCETSSSVQCSCN